MAVRDEYVKRSMAELELAALQFLVARGAVPNGRNNFGCGSIGNAIFPDAQGAVNCSAPYARIAGKVMSRLRVKGEADWYVIGDWGGWSATHAGVRRAKKSHP